MIQRLITYSLILLFAVQTIGIVLDDYQPHQLIDGQIVFDHDSQKTPLSIECHHCCHCHGSAQLNPYSLEMITSFSFNSKPFSYGFIDSSISNDPLYRPPIAIFS